MKQFLNKSGYLFMIICLVGGLLTIPAQAATEEEIEASIALGVPWLASQQNPDGSWSYTYKTAQTSFAVLKLIDYVKEVPEIDSWTDPSYIYHYEVVDGLNYLFNRAYTVPISVQPAGDPDTRVNGLGVRFIGFDDYETSIALMALGATMTPTRTVTVGPLTGETYADVVQDIVDYLSYVQRESTWARGGWGYQGNPDWADNSVSGYAALGLGYAQSFGATIPQFVKDELTHWIGIIQSPAGYSYYRPPAVWGDPYGDLLLRTGNLLYEMALVGMPVEDANVQAALTYIEANWALGGNSYQRAYCLMKGLEAYGITDEMSVGTSGDWFDELSTYIVSTQNDPPGNWPRDPHDYYSPYSMTVAWALLTLEKSVAIPQITVYVDIKPGSCPNPLNVKDKGVLPVAILGTEDFDVSTIDPSTIVLEGVYPLRWALEDVATPFDGEECECTTEGSDGFMDLTLKFNTQEIIGELGDVTDGEVRPLYLTGNLMEEFGGTLIEGSDCVIIKAKNLGKELTVSSGDVPEEYALFENFPNPFNPITTIQFALPEQSFVKLEVYNSLGKRVSTLVAETLEAGIYSFNWNAINLPSGVYIYSIQSKNFFESKKMILMK